jgi:hypothetical protein
MLTLMWSSAALSNTYNIPTAPAGHTIKFGTDIRREAPPGS